MNRRKWLRVAYLSAAIADFTIAARELIPRFLGFEEYGYQAGIVGAVGISWGILLIAADRKPFERKWILAPTILVISFISTIFIHSTATGLVPMFLGLPSSIAGIIILTINIYAWKTSRGRSD